MVDVSNKETTLRTAVAGGEITMNEQAFRAVIEGNIKKGDVFGAARIAGILAAKKTSGLIPLCHTLVMEFCSIGFTPVEDSLTIKTRCTVKVTGKTGAEMEALTGAAVSLLTIYDMCKYLDRSIIIGNVRLMEKSGGKSGHYIYKEAQ
ncbi:MAG: cyclic pyranopterin monophosphate synthase MoaC [Treponema sp.]|nr:cyclic pyranopterin monophosphate synthase MoaC [Treponema sp.]